MANSTAKPVHGELLNWAKIKSLLALDSCQDARFRHPIGSLMVTLARLARPGGLRSVVAESVRKRQVTEGGAFQNRIVADLRHP